MRICGYKYIECPPVLRSITFSQIITVTLLARPRVANMSYKKSLEESVKASKAEYRQLGKSGLRVSVPILGAMSFGDPEWNSWVLDEEASLPLLKAAYDRGLNSWDTANIYSNGASEKIIGKALKKYNIPRHKVIILTKCFAYIGEEHVSHLDRALPNL
jgi:hypothetical protein